VRCLCVPARTAFACRRDPWARGTKCGPHRRAEPSELDKWSSDAGGEKRNQCRDVARYFGDIAGDRVDASELFVRLTKGFGCFLEDRRHSFAGLVDRIPGLVEHPAKFHERNSQKSNQHSKVLEEAWPGRERLVCPCPELDLRSAQVGIHVSGPP